MLVSSFVNSPRWDKLPAHLRCKDIFSKFVKLDKPFDEIGLSNSLEKTPTMVEGSPYYLGFSASGIDGIWDIATMSMRGVCSCMHWVNGHSSHLIGSMLDPFLGIVYLTDMQQTGYGISYRRRALVRFMHNILTKTNEVFVERIYKDTGNRDPCVYNNKDPISPRIKQIFKRYLQSKINPSIGIKVVLSKSANRVVPKTTTHNAIAVYQRSMSDASVQYKQVDDEFCNKFTQ